MSSSSRLSPPLRQLLMLMNIVLGLVPSLLFFAWVERGTALPWLPIQLEWPWIHLEAAPLAAQVAWNIALVLLFGLFHSLLAQPSIHRALEKVFPAQAIRSIYICATGLLLLAVMGFWQSTGIVLWSLPLRPGLLMALSMALYLLLMSGCAVVMARFGTLHFIGIQQLAMGEKELGRTAGNEKLIATGFYRYVRHPIYTFTLLAFLVAPLMTLDRMLVVISVSLYLAVAIPVEERKLIAIFGKDYEAYRKRVPAVIPKLT